MATRDSDGQCTIEVAIVAVVFSALVIGIAHLASVAPDVITQTQLSRSLR